MANNLARRVAVVATPSAACSLDESGRFLTLGERSWPESLRAGRSLRTSRRTGASKALRPIPAYRGYICGPLAFFSVSEIVCRSFNERSAEFSIKDFCGEAYSTTDCGASGAGGQEAATGTGCGQSAHPDRKSIAVVSESISLSLGIGGVLFMDCDDLLRKFVLLIAGGLDLSLEVVELYLHGFSPLEVARRPKGSGYRKDCYPAPAPCGNEGHQNLCSTSPSVARYLSAIKDPATQMNSHIRERRNVTWL